ncbi:hypothetical protein FAIPA1_20369 [Frankia sp. AiPs1]
MAASRDQRTVSANSRWKSMHSPESANAMIKYLKIAKWHLWAIDRSFSRSLGSNKHTDPSGPPGRRVPQGRDQGRYPPDRPATTRNRPQYTHRGNTLSTPWNIIGGTTIERSVHMVFADADAYRSDQGGSTGVRSSSDLPCDGGASWRSG